MLRHSPFRLLFSILFVAALVWPTGSVRAQSASPEATPVLDASQVTGTWVARANDQRNGQVDGEPLQGSPDVLWSANLQADVYLPPAPGEHIVIAQTSFSVVALDRMTGSELWSVPISSTSSAPSLVNGRIYTGSLDGALALDATTGETVWTFVPTYENEADFPPDAPPTTLIDAPVAVVDGVVYASGGPFGSLWALDAETGAELWRADTQGGMPAIASVADGTVYITSDVGLGAIGVDPATDRARLQAFDAATGAPSWEVELPVGTSTTGAPVILDDTSSCWGVTGR